ncbi:MAG TPA: 3-oxoacyl-[acyl-carrier-protein] synthase III C-terminal domain-containing protein [Polyangiaceae bacterium]
MERPPLEIEQTKALERILAMHLESARAHEGADDAFAHRMRKIVMRCGCQPAQIRARGYAVREPSEIYDVARAPRGQGALARMAVYERETARLFAALYPDHDDDPPDDLVHVTCTGYVAPSPAQALVARRGWHQTTRVTHAYHMGCYASLPAIRIAAGCIATASPKRPRVDVVHTELCTLHLDPSNHAIEQIVVQSLFADGCMRYSIERENRPRSLRCVALAERTVPDSTESMRWVMADWGMQMTLARDVPEHVGKVLRPFVADLMARAGLGVADLKRTQFAVHPGGPRIIDGVRETLELSERQVSTSREVLLDYGNMSSATLPHVWKRMLDDPGVANGTPIVSLAFGPGITISGAVFVKQR